MGRPKFWPHRRPWAVTSNLGTSVKIVRKATVTCENSGCRLEVVPLEGLQADAKGGAGAQAKRVFRDPARDLACWFCPEILQVLICRIALSCGSRARLPVPHTITRDRRIAISITRAQNFWDGSCREPLKEREPHHGGQRSRDSKKGLWAQVAARNRKTRLASLEKTHSSPATLSHLQAQDQKSGSRKSVATQEQDPSP